MPTHVDYDNINALLTGIATNLKTKINAIDLTQAQKDAIALIDKIVKTGDGTKYLANDGNYKTLPLDQISNLQTQLSTINSTLNITTQVESWNTTTVFKSLITARFGFGCVISNGKVYIIGGYGGSYLNSMEIYDITTNTISSGATLPVSPAYSPACFVYNNKIYCKLNSTNMHIYDIASNTWSSIPSSIPSQIGGSYVTTVINNNIAYFVANTYYNSALCIYNIDSNTWSSGANMPIGLSTGSVVLNSNKIYVIGGINGSNTYFANTYIYDITSNTWSSGANMPVAKVNDASVYYNGKIYCIGGTTSSSAAINSIHIYDIVSNSWTTDSLILSGNNANMGAVVYNNTIYIFGGSSGGAASLSTIRGLNLPYTTYSITLPTSLSNTLAILTTTGDGTKLLTDNGTYQTYMPTGYRELTSDELNTLIGNINTSIS